MADPFLAPYRALVEEMCPCYPQCASWDDAYRRGVAKAWRKHLGQYDLRVLELAVEQHVKASSWPPSVHELEQRAKAIESALAARDRARAVEQNAPGPDVAGFREAATGRVFALERHHFTNELLVDEDGALRYREDGISWRLPRAQWGEVAWLSAEQLQLELGQAGPTVRVVRDLGEVRQRSKKKAM